MKRPRWLSMAELALSAAILIYAAVVTYIIAVLHQPSPALLWLLVALVVVHGANLILHGFQTLREKPTGMVTIHLTGTDLAVLRHDVGAKLSAGLEKEVGVAEVLAATSPEAVPLHLTSAQVSELAALLTGRREADTKENS